MKLTTIFVVVLGVLVPGVADAAVIDADPSNYRALLGTLGPGDTMVLAPGSYARLTLSGLRGEPGGWIVITGPTTGEPAIITSESCCNTVQLYDSAYVAVENLVVDVGGLAVDAINAKDSVSHHIRIEGCTLQNFPNDQQIVGINTKSTAWNWTIRRNRIIAPGTGMYLGNSNGAAPFIAGIIEQNLIVDSVGYSMQIKHQNSYDLQPGMPAGPNATILRHNVFIKDDRPSTSGDRPNLLLSGFPDSGPGSEDHYEVYGNFFYYNPRESLIQAAGRLSIHDNVFVGSGEADGQTALLITPHQGKNVQVAHVYNNTIYGVARGIRITQQAATSDAVIGNLVFATDPIGGSISNQRGNMTDTIAAATSYVTSPSTALGTMDFYPLPGKVSGAALDLSVVASDVDYDRDFNGTPKGGFTYRGAYAGEGQNPGWQLDENLKDEVSVGGGSDAGPGGSGDGGRDDGGGGGSGDGDASGGCGCASGGGGDDPMTWLLSIAVGLAVRRRRIGADPQGGPRTRQSVID